MIRVAIVDDKAEYRDSLRTLFHGTPGFCCCSAFASAEDTLLHLPLEDTDVLLVDIVLGERRMNGIELVRVLKPRRPELIFVMLTVYDTPEHLFNALCAGAHGYLLKRTRPAGLIEGVREACQGGGPLSPPIARKVIQHFHRLPKPHPDVETLSPEQLAVLDGLACGDTYKEVANRLKCGESNVRYHMKSIYDKLHVTSRSAAVRKYRGLS